MGTLENKILDLFNKASLNEDTGASGASWENLGGPTPSETLKGPIDYAKNVKQAQVPSAPGHVGTDPINGVGEIGDDEADENDAITDGYGLDDDGEDEDSDEKDDIEETFASLLAKLAEDEEGGETSLKDKDDDFGTPEDDTLPDVDSKLDTPDELVTQAPGAKAPGGVSEDETFTEPKETLVGDDIDSMTDEPEKLVTQAPGAKTPGGVSESEEDDEDDDDDDDKKEDEDEKVEEDLKAMFSGIKLTEAGKVKAATIFKAAVARRVTEEKGRVQKIATKKLKEAFEVLKTRYTKKQNVFESKLTTQVDQYLNYVVENWMKENRLAVERGIRAELAEGFIAGLKNLFVEHWIEVPESKVDVVTTLGKKVNGLESKLNESIEMNVKMKSALNAYRKEEVIRAQSAGLADTQREKLKKLAEGVPYTTRKEFNEQVLSLKESYFPKAATPVKRDEKPLVEEKTNQTSADPTLAAVLNTTAKMNRR